MISLMPPPTPILHSNLIPQQHLRACASIPPAVSTRAQHKPTRRIDMNPRNHTTPVPRDDRERNGLMSLRLCGLGEVVDAEDIV
jgi:hypothetical protein